MTRGLYRAPVERRARLAGTGAYLPARVMDAAAVVAEGAPLSVEEILRLTGIAERRRAAPEEAASDLGVHAARRALDDAGLAPADVDRLVVATVSSDQPVPSTACFVQHALGLDTVPACDVSAACSGFLYALDVAARAVATGDEVVLVVASEVRSRFVDPTDRATAALFGDGAGAAVVTRASAGDPWTIDSLLLRADGRGRDAVRVAAGGSRLPATAATVAAGQHTIHMADGVQVFLSAVEGMLDVAEALLTASGLTMSDVDLVVPHQPNRAILERLARWGRIPPEKLFVNVERTGNVAGATAAIALDEARRGPLAARPGQRVLLLTAGAGFVAGAGLLTT